LTLESTFTHFSVDHSLLDMGSIQHEQLLPDERLQTLEVKGELLQQLVDFALTQEVS
jgi:hypothetical protein